MVFFIYSWSQKKWETLSRGLWTVWRTWTAWTWVTGASDLRMNLLVGDEATHYINVPEVVKKDPEGHFPLSHVNTTDHDTNLNIFPEGLKKSEIDRENVISDLQGTNNSDLYGKNDIGESQRAITTSYFGHKVNSQLGNRVMLVFFKSILH